VPEGVPTRGVKEVLLEFLVTSRQALPTAAVVVVRAIAAVPAETSAHPVVSFSKDGLGTRLVLVDIFHPSLLD
jgi:hypothetical protein